MATDLKQITLLVAELEKVNREIIEAGGNTDKLVGSFTNLNNIAKDLGKTVNIDAEATKKLNAAKKEAETIEKKLIQTEAKLNEQRSVQSKKLIELQALQQKQLQLLKAEAKVKTAAKGSNEKLAATISLYEKRLKTVNQTTAKGKAEADKLRGAIDRMNTKLTEQSSSFTKIKRGIGSYKAAIMSTAKQLFAGVGIVAGIRALGRVLKNGAQTIANFDKAQATTAATLGKTTDEIKDLTLSAIELGKVTQFTASEVSVLQNELAKLGFTSAEIKSSTAGILDLAAATDADLGESAKVAGAALRAFGLDATEMDRVVSVLAVATTKSALSFSDYGTALSTVAPVSKAFGFEIEDTVALLGKLKDAGFDASSAGTATRNIMLNMADANGKLAKALGGSVENFDELIPAMVKLRDGGIDLNETLQLTDKRSVAAFNQFLNTAEGAKELRDSITDVNGELQDMVTTKTDNVIGASKRLGSAWEGFTLKFRESSGVFKKVLDSLAGFINSFTNDNIATWKKWFDTVTFAVFDLTGKEQARIDSLSKKLRTASKEEIESTLKINKAKLEEGSKVDKLLLKMLNDRLAEVEKAELVSSEKTEEIVEKTETKKTTINKSESDKRIAQAKTESDEKTKLKWKEINSILEAENNRKIQEESLIDETEDFFAKWDEEQQKEIDNAIESTNRILEEKQRLIDEEERLEQEAFDRKKARNEENLNQSIELANSLFDFRMSRLDAEYEAAEGNEKKQAEIRVKQAKAEKQQALFGIAVATAKGIVSALGSLPPNVPLSILIGATGLVQAATVAATPIPQFAKGTDYAPGGLSLVGEKGRELIQNPKGEVFMANNPALVNLERGSKVITNQKTEQILNDRNIINELRGVKKAIQRQPRQLSESEFSKRQRGYNDGFRAARHRMN